ncbi:MAG: helix-turn-helix domain-containing protein [Sphingobacteriales bacterium]
MKNERRNSLYRPEVKKAVQLLENTELKISQIAYEIGFETPEYFSKLFKKEYDLRPSAYVYFMRKTKAEAILKAYRLDWIDT